MGNVEKIYTEHRGVQIRDARSPWPFKSGTVVRDTGGPSLYNLLLNPVAPVVLRWMLDGWKICAALDYDITGPCFVNSHRFGGRSVFLFVRAKKNSPAIRRTGL